MGNLLFSLVIIIIISLSVKVIAAPVDTLIKVRESGAFTIGYRQDATPFSYIRDDGTKAGYSIDLCLQIAKAIEKVVNREIKINFEPVTKSKRFHMLQNNEIDIECGISTQTITRSKYVDFTLPIFVTGTEMLVRKHSDIKDLNNILGKKIAVPKDTTTKIILNNELNNRYKRIHKKVKIRDMEPKNAFAALETGEIDAYFADRTRLFKKVEESKHFRLSGQFYSYEPYAFMIRNGDSRLRWVADTVLAHLYRSGEIWEIYEKHFGETEPSKLLVAMYMLLGFPVVGEEDSNEVSYLSMKDPRDLRIDILTQDSSINCSWFSNCWSPNKIRLLNKNDYDKESVVGIKEYILGSLRFHLRIKGFDIQHLIAFASVLIASSSFFGGVLIGKRREVRQHTIDVLLTLMSESILADVNTKMARYNIEYIKTKKSVSGYDTDPEIDKVFIDMLDFYEFICSSAFAGSLNKKTIKKVRGGAMRSTYHTCYQYIQDRRNILDRPNLYEAFQRFVEKVIKDDLV